MKKEQKISANEFTKVKDIRDIFLYSRTGYILGYLQVFPFNMDLLPFDERKAKTDMLSRTFDSDRKDWCYMSYPREVDLGKYKQHIKDVYDSCLDDYGRKEILREMLMDATEHETSGKNYQHQQYIKLWKLVGSDLKESEKVLRSRLLEFRARYESVGIKTEILKQDAIIKLCNLYGNSRQAPFDVPVNGVYDPILFMR